jgi:hypothetical protein
MKCRHPSLALPLLMLAVSGAPAAEPPGATSTPAVSVAANNEVKDLTFDSIKFDMKKDDDFERTMLTDEIEQLSGKSIRIRGYIFPGGIYKRTGITQFVLVRDNQECCFGPGAALFDCVIVRMKQGKSADFSVRPITVEGEFAIREFRQGKKLRAIYELRGDSAE